MLTTKLHFVTFNVARRLYSKWQITVVPNQLYYKKSASVTSTFTRSTNFRNMSSVNGGKVTFDEVKTLKDDKKVYLIDVREPSELQETGSIPGSINIPLDQVENVLKSFSNAQFQQKYKRSKPDAASPIIFSCKSGRRAASAMESTIKLGFQNVRNYEGSWLDWEKNTKK